MQIKLTRDEARAIVTRFIPFLEQLCQTRIQDNKANPYSWQIIECCLQEVRIKIERRLLTEGKNFTVKNSTAQGITFYHLLLLLPLDPADVWLNLLRQNIINQLHLQL